MIRYGNVRTLREDVEKTRIIDFNISNESRDRYKTRLLLDRWELENYRNNPIVSYQHDALSGDELCGTGSDPDKVIGYSEVFKDGGQLVGSATFEPANINSLAEKIFQKVLHGTLRTASVSWIETKKGGYGEGEERRGGEKETYTFGGQELLEWSVVNVPGNPYATRRHFKVVASNSLAYLQRILGEEYSLEDIEKMTVRNVLDIADGKRDGVPVTEAKEEEVTKAKHNLSFYEKRLQLLKMVEK